MAVHHKTYILHRIRINSRGLFHIMCVLRRQGALPVKYVLYTKIIECTKQIRSDVNKVHIDLYSDILIHQYQY